MLARSSSVIPGGRGSFPAGKRGVNSELDDIVGNPAVTRRCWCSQRPNLSKCDGPYRPATCFVFEKTVASHRLLFYFNWSMQTPIFYPKSEFIETVSNTGFEGGGKRNLRCGGQGHGKQSLASRDDFRTSEHHPRREDDHLERRHHPRRSEACWSWTRRGHIFGALLSRGGGMRHEVRLKPSSSFLRSNLISRWPIQAPLQDLSWRV